jgi:hypothetical protein
MPVCILRYVLRVRRLRVLLHALLMLAFVSDRALGEPDYDLVFRGGTP